MLDEDTSLHPAASIVTPGVAEALLTFDHRKLQDYFEQLLPLILDADVTDLENSLFSYPDTVEKFKCFANDPQSPVIFILKEKEGAKDEGWLRLLEKRKTMCLTDLIDDATSPPTFSYTVSQEITYLPTHVGSLAVIKRLPTLDQSRPLQNQLQLINLPGAPNSGEPGQTSAYEFLHSYIHLAVSPYFNAYVDARHGKSNEASSSKSKNEDNKMGVPMAKKKMAELELSLLHLQQNVEIPEISLNIHPVVQKAIDKVRIV
jgi:dynein heavy chain 1